MPARWNTVEKSWQTRHISGKTNKNTFILFTNEIETVCSLKEKLSFFQNWSNARVGVSKILK